MNGLDGSAGVTLVVLVAAAPGGAGPFEFPREADGLVCVLRDVFVLHLSSRQHRLD